MWHPVRQNQLASCYPPETLVAFIASARLRLGLVHPSSRGPRPPCTSPAAPAPASTVLVRSRSMAALWWPRAVAVLLPPELPREPGAGGGWTGSTSALPPREALGL